MSISIRVPDSIFGGWAHNFGRLRVGFLYHSLQCDQRWLFLLRWRRGPGIPDYRFGYRTRGDATPNLLTYRDAGWHWPWKFRSVCGRA